MSTNFPTSLDTFTTPAGNTTLGGSAPTHTSLHTNEGDAIEALQAKVGVDNSVVTTSHEYRIVTLEGDNPRFINVKTYDAAGDGSTDDTTAIQNALDAAADAGGGTVYIPPGTYMTSQLTVGNKVRVTGAGGNTTLKAKFGTTGSVIAIDNSATRVVLDHFAIDVDSVADVDGILMDNTGVAQDSLHRLTYLWIFNAGRDGIHLGPAIVETIVSNCYVLGSGRNGYHTEVGATDNRFVACTAGASTEDGFFIAGNNTSYTACKAFYSGFDGSSFADNFNGFTLRPGVGEDLHAVTLTSCEAQNNARNGFFVDGGATSAICTYIVGDGLTSDGNNMFGGTGVGFAFSRVLYSTFKNLVHRQQSPTGSAAYGIGLFNDQSYTTYDGGYILGATGNLYVDGTVFGPYKVSNLIPFNPAGQVTAPTVPASASAYTNILGVDCNVYISGGTVSDIAIGGDSTGLTSGWFPVPAGQTITLTYTGAPTWTWWGN